MTSLQAKWLTAIVIFGMAVVTIGYDVVAMMMWGPDATISRVTGYAMQEYPLIALWLVFGLGLFVGHAWLSSW